jgi:hypothetical protein
MGSIGKIIDVHLSVLRSICACPLYPLFVLLLLFARALGAPGAAADALLGCRQAIADVRGAARLTLERRGGAWEPVAAELLAGGIGNALVSPLARIRSVEALEMRGGDGGVHIWPGGSAQFAALPGVRRLSVRGMDLMPWEFAAVLSLRGLESLDIAGGCNRFWGEGYLAKLAALRQLRRLRIDPLELTDEAVAGLKALARVPDLGIGLGQFYTQSTLLDLAAVSNLRQLHLSRLAPEGLRALEKLPHLEDLSVYALEVAPGERGLAALAALRSLTVHTLGPEGMPAVALPAGLRHLGVEYDVAPRLALRGAEHLVEVEIVDPDRGGPGDEGHDLAWPQAIPGLRDLTLSEATAPDIAVLAGVGSLRRLAIRSGCRGFSMGADGLRALGGLRQLESLEVEEEFAGPADGRYAALDAVGGLAGLRSLTLVGFPGLAPGGLVWPLRLAGLRALRLRLSDDAADLPAKEILPKIARLSDLEELEFGGAVDDSALGQLAAAEKLRRLDVSAAHGFSDAGLAALMEAMPNLHEVKLTIVSPALASPPRPAGKSPPPGAGTKAEQPGAPEPGSAHGP